MFVAIGLVLVLAGGALQERTREQWIEWARAGFPAAPEERVDTLIAMLPLLGSSDPVLRDEVAYAGAARWLLREPRLSPDEIRRVLPQWRALMRGEATRGVPPPVQARSFAALCLSVAAARDLQTPYLEPREMSALLDEALAYLVEERDLRGYVPGTGWIHAVAHVADLVKFLARNPKLAPEDHQRVLNAVRARLDATDVAFAWDEDERLALALHSLVRRPDFQLARLEAWLASWTVRHQALWAGGPNVDARMYAQVSNAKGVARALLAALAMESTPSPQVDAARAAVTAALAKMR